MMGGAAVAKEDEDRISALFGKTKEDAVFLAKNAIEERQHKKKMKSKQA